MPRATRKVRAVAGKMAKTTAEVHIMRQKVVLTGMGKHSIWLWISNTNHRFLSRSETKNTAMPAASRRAGLLTSTHER